jgi:hypothetical protein
VPAFLVFTRGLDKRMRRLNNAKKINQAMSASSVFCPSEKTVQPEVVNRNLTDL